MSTPGGSGQLASRMGIEPGFLVLQRGFGDDCDSAISEEIAKVSGSALLGEDSQEVVDAVITWYRDGDDDLVDELVDCLTYLTESGAIWLLTPKVGRDGHVEASDIQDAVNIAGLSQTSTIAVAPNWTATKIMHRKAKK